MSDEPIEIGALLEILRPSLVGTSIPTLTSGTTQIYDLEIAIETLIAETNMDTPAIIKCIRNLNNTYIGSQNPIFVTDDFDMIDALGFTLFNTKHPTD